MSSWRFAFIIGWLSFLLFLYIRDQNEILILRRTIPQIERELRDIQEENQRLRFALNTLMSPQELVRLSMNPAYGHLEYPKETGIIVLENNNSP